MPNIKTAISVEPDLFAEVEELAGAMEISRSRFFAIAAAKLVKDIRRSRVTQQLNETYSDKAAEEDQEILRQMRPTHRRLAEAEW